MELCIQRSMKEILGSRFARPRMTDGVFYSHPRMEPVVFAFIVILG